MSTFPWLIPDVVTLPVAAPAAPGQIDHVADGLARLPFQFQQPNIVALLSIYLSRFNDLEACYYALLTQRTIYNSVGVQLDLIGKIVGQPRGGLNDADYQRYLFARIATNNSEGLTEEMITVAKLVLNDPTFKIGVYSLPIDSIEVIVTGNVMTDATAAILVGFLQTAKMAGTKLDLRTQGFADAVTFFTPYTSFLNGALGSGQTIITVDTTAGYPLTGTIILDVGGANQENVTYSNLDATHFLNCSVTTLPHIDGSRIDALIQPGAGLGDSNDVGQPDLTPYTNVGITGGQMADARE